MAGCRSVAMVADRYAQSGDDPPLTADQGQIARYARVRDYHRVMKKRLHTVADTLRLRIAGSDFRTSRLCISISSHSACFFAALFAYVTSGVFFGVVFGNNILLLMLMKCFACSPFCCSGFTYRF